MKLKKMGIAILALTLAVFSLGALAACGPSPEEAIRDAITKEFDSFKNIDESAVEQVTQSDSGQDIISEFGLTDEEYAALILDGFDYTINSIEVDGSTAKANLTITSKSYSAFEDKLTSAAEEITNDPNFASMSEDEVMALLPDAFKQSLEDIDVVSEDVTIEYTKEGNVWTPTNSNSALGALDSVVFAQ